MCLIGSGNTLKTQNSPFQQYNLAKFTIPTFIVIPQNEAMCSAHDRNAKSHDSWFSQVYIFS